MSIISKVIEEQVFNSDQDPEVATLLTAWFNALEAGNELIGDDEAVKWRIEHLLEKIK